MSTDRFEKRHRVFTAAVRLPAVERPAFLESECGSDAAMRAEVEAMLAQDASGGGTFDRAIDAGGAQYLAGVLSDDDDALDRPPHPDQLGKYRIIGVLGEGGMGVVYEAEQDNPKRRVALKVVRSAMVTRGLLQRFRHEARVLGHLRHPGIAQIYEAGSADSGAGGQPYFAMELVRGDSITAYADEHGLSADARLELLAQLCDILEYAHQKGVIHRDIKPQNILVVTDMPGSSIGHRQTQQLKVLDFGVARATDADLNTVTLQTTMGQLVGTVPYMSPEQASGNPAEIDTRSDVYSVGVLGWELLTGRLPYDVRGKMVHEAVRVIREEEASRLSSIDRSFRGDVETILAKALEKDKDRRYQSVAEFGLDIRRHLAHEPIAARPASTFYQLRKFTRRNKVLVGGVAATLIVAVIGAFIATMFAVNASRTAASARRASYISGLAAAAAALDQHEYGEAVTYLDALPEEYLGWEAAYLRAELSDHLVEWAPATGPPVAPMRHGGAPVFAPDGATFYAVLSDRSIGSWDVASGHFLRAIPTGSSDDALWRIAMHGGSMRFSRGGGRRRPRDASPQDR